MSVSLERRGRRPNEECGVKEGENDTHTHTLVEAFDLLACLPQPSVLACLSVWVWGAWASSKCAWRRADCMILVVVVGGFYLTGVDGVANGSRRSKWKVRRSIWITYTLRSQPTQWSIRARARASARGEELSCWYGTICVSCSVRPRIEWWWQISPPPLWRLLVRCKQMLR